MAKNKKAASGSSSLGKKKLTSTSSPKPVKKREVTIDKKKAEAISQHINKMSVRFENLIEECKFALKQLTTTELEISKI